jgi:hypothetical protein
MTLSLTTIPVFGIIPSATVESGSWSAPTPHTEVCEPIETPHDVFGRVVALYQGNEFLLSELQSIGQKLASARAYRDTPGSNPALAEARLLQLRARHSAALAMLRANRHEARHLLGRPEHDRTTISA